MERKSKRGRFAPIPTCTMKLLIWAPIDGSAISGAALENTEVGAPWPNGITVLVGKGSGDLVKMSHVMGDPCGEKLGECDRAKGGMGSAAFEVFGLQIPGAKFGKVRCAEVCKFFKEIVQ